MNERPTRLSSLLSRSSVSLASQRIHYLWKRLHRFCLIIIAFCNLNPPRVFQISRTVMWGSIWMKRNILYIFTIGPFLARVSWWSCIFRRFHAVVYELAQYSTICIILYLALCLSIFFIWQLILIIKLNATKVKNIIRAVLSPARQYIRI